MLTYDNSIRIRQQLVYDVRNARQYHAHRGINLHKLSEVGLLTCAIDRFEYALITSHEYASPRLGWAAGGGGGL